MQTLNSLRATITRSPGSRQLLSTSNGQVIVEYILLLVIAVAIAVLMTSTMVSRSADSPGFIVVKWMQILETIGKDVVDEGDEAAQ